MFSFFCWWSKQEWLAAMNFVFLLSGWRAVFSTSWETETESGVLMMKKKKEWARQIMVQIEDKMGVKMFSLSTCSLKRIPQCRSAVHAELDCIRNHLNYLKLQQISSHFPACTGRSLVRCLLILTSDPHTPPLILYLPLVKRSNSISKTRCETQCTVVVEFNSVSFAAIF